MTGEQGRRTKSPGAAPLASPAPSTTRARPSGRVGRPGRQVQAKADAAARRVDRDIFAVVVLVVVFFVALALPARAEPVVAATSLGSLEVRVWTADDQALPAVEQAVVRWIQIDPSSATAHYLLSHLMVRNFSHDPSDLYTLKQASDLAQQALDLDPRSDVGYVALANILDLMGQADRGLSLLSEAEGKGLRPSWRFYFTRARLMADDTKVDRVLGLLETALAFTDSEPKIVVPYVVAMLQSQAHGAELIAKLESWNARFPSPLFQLTEAIAAAEGGDARRASDLYAAILRQHPDYKEAKVNAAILLYRDLHDPVAATALFENVLATQGDTLTPPARAMILAHMGAAYVQRRQFDLAERSFAAAASADTNNLGIIDFAAKTYRDAKASEPLVALIRRLNDTLPGTGVLHALLGETLSEKLQQHDAALRAFADAITLDPDRGDYYNGMGLALYREKSFPEALKLFATAIEIDPNDATAHYNQACVLSLLGRADDAVNSLAEALTLDSRLTATARNDGDFASIKGSLRFMQLVQETPAEGGPVYGH